MKTLQNKPKAGSEKGLTSRMSADRARPRPRENKPESHTVSLAPKGVSGTTAVVGRSISDTIEAGPVKPPCRHARKFLKNGYTSCWDCMVPLDGWTVARSRSAALAPPDDGLAVSTEDLVTCVACGGRGYVRGTVGEDCDECGGSGLVDPAGSLDRVEGEPR